MMLRSFQPLDPRLAPDRQKTVGPFGCMRVKNLNDILIDTLIEGQTIVLTMLGISNEEGFFRSLFNRHSFTPIDLGKDVIPDFEAGKDNVDFRG